jgi:hypothetical protein
MHRELYPNDCSITPELHRELQAMILHAYTGVFLRCVDPTRSSYMLDTIFSEVSLAPFDTEELQRALSIVDYLHGDFCSYIGLGRLVDTSIKASSTKIQPQTINIYGHMVRMLLPDTLQCYDKLQ